MNIHAGAVAFLRRPFVQTPGPRARARGRGESSGQRRYRFTLDMYVDINLKYKIIHQDMYNDLQLPRLTMGSIR